MHSSSSRSSFIPALPSHFGLRAALLGMFLLAASAASQVVLADDVALTFDSQWNFDLHTEYKGAAGTVTPADDSKSVKLSFDFSNGGSFVSYGRHLDNQAALSGIEVKATGLGQVGLTITDSTGQTFVYQLGVPGTTESKLSVNLSSPTQSYGGANDKTIHYPLQGLAILVSRSPDHLTGDVTITSILLKPSN